MLNKSPNLLDLLGWDFARAFLQGEGYEIKKTKVEMTYSCYHNDVETVEVEVMGVFKDGKPYQQPNYSNYDDDEWFKRAFEFRFKHALLKMLLK